MNDNPDMRFWEQAVPALLDWYRMSCRDLPWRHNPTPYETWISEVMLQQTRVEAVKAYYVRFLRELPDLEALAHVSEERLLKLWEGLGYYSRARNLQKAAQQMLERHGGIPADYAALRTLAGIGPYTAGAIASIAFGIPVAAVDGNVLRVHARVRGDNADISLTQTKERVTAQLNAVIAGLSGKDIGDFNQALMELGALLCVPNGPPQCEQCPWRIWCVAKQHGTTAMLPVKSGKKPRRIETWSVLLLTVDGRFALEKRKKSGLLAGLWGLPMLEGQMSSSELIEAVRRMGLQPLQIQTLGKAKHIFTHVEWYMQGYQIAVEAAEVPFEWAQPCDIVQAVPSAFRYFIPEVDGEHD